MTNRRILKAFKGKQSHQQNLAFAHSSSQSRPSSSYGSPVIDWESEEVVRSAASTERGKLSNVQMARVSLLGKTLPSKLFHSRWAMEHDSEVKDFAKLAFRAPLVKEDDLLLRNHIGIPDIQALMAPEVDPALLSITGSSVSSDPTDQTFRNIQFKIADAVGPLLLMLDKAEKEGNPQKPSESSLRLKAVIRRGDLSQNLRSLFPATKSPFGQRVVPIGLQERPEKPHTRPSTATTVEDTSSRAVAEVRFPEAVPLLKENSCNQKKSAVFRESTKTGWPLGIKICSPQKGQRRVDVHTAVRNTSPSSPVTASCGSYSDFRCIKSRLGSFYSSERHKRNLVTPRKSPPYKHFGVKSHKVSSPESSSSVPVTIVACKTTVLDLVIKSLYELENKDFKRFQCKLPDFHYGDTRPIECGRLDGADRLKTAILLLNYYGEEKVLELVFHVLIAIDMRAPAENLQKERRQICSPPSTDAVKNDTVLDILMRTLCDLKQEDFELFQYKLSDFTHRDKRSIGYGRLEGANRIKTAHILRDHYGEQSVLELTYQVFMRSNLRGPAENLQKECGIMCTLKIELSEKSLNDFRINYMENVRDQYQWMKENNGLLGDHFNMDRRYTNLLLIKKHRNQREKENEIIFSGRKHLEIMENRSSDYSTTTIEALFDSDEKEKNQKVVLLQGPPGIGKTMTAQKIMLDWATGKLYQDKFKYVFYMSSTEINRVTGQTNISGYITEICQLTCPQHVIELVLQDAEKILFLIDGFDELDQSCMEKTGVCKDHVHNTTKECFLNCLFTRKVLKKSSLIITTRPFMLKKLQALIECPCYVEIMGLKDRKEYFFNFFDNKDEAARFLDLIKQNETLFTMCVVPMTCWIVCTVLKQQMEEGLNLIHYNTSTSVYTLYLQSLLEHHCRTSDLPLKSYIKRLCELAKDGVWNKKVLFKELDMRNYKLPMSSIKSLVLNENMFKRPVTPQTCYSFIHLSVQEFFAALYYVLNDEDEDSSDSEKLGSQEEVKALLETSENSPHLALTVQFLFGLSSEEQVNDFAEIIDCNISSGSKAVLEEWLKKRISTAQCHNDIMHYMYEVQDNDFVKRMMSHLSHMEIEGVKYGFDSNEDKLIDRSLSFCLLKSSSHHTLTFKFHGFSQEGLQALSSGLHKCSKLTFDWCRFPNSDISCLFKSRNKITELQLLQCSLISSSCKNLISVITNQFLTKLHLTWNALEDSGAKILCHGLRHSGCVLQDLSLEKCSLTTLCCEDLCSVIISNHHLTKLGLSENDLQDSGVKCLCEGLKHPNCTLQELRLEECKLTSSCCEDLYYVFTTNQTLTKLDLSDNILNDSGVGRLCAGLEHPKCTIQELGLRECDLTSSCCQDLSSVIIKNKFLTKLDLSSNDVDDLAVGYLCEALKHADCVLQELRLENCLLTSSCCDSLHSVLIANRSLTTLDLSWNEIQDLGVKQLCDALKHQDCILEQLMLEDCCLTSSCCEDLYSVIIKNKSLTKLNIAVNKFQKPGVHLLSDGLRHPDCTLQELRLAKKPINVGEFRKRKGLLENLKLPVTSLFS
ncbi:NACHT, LRR and PYD domains-containing protein 3-like [Pelodytes ibericus]